MRKPYLLIAIAFLFQSCFSYKAMDNDISKMKEGETYKIGRSDKNSIVIFHGIKDSTILVNEKFEEKQIPIKDITSIKKRKFSIVKTIVYPVAATVGLGLMIGAALSL